MSSPTVLSRQTVRVATIGAIARRALAGSSAWTVAAVFEKSVYLNHATHWLCLVPTAAGAGPLHLCCATTPPDWQDVVAVGDPLEHDAAILHGPRGLTLDTSRAGVWRPAPPPPADPRAYRTGLQALEHALSSWPPPSDGLAPFAATKPDTRHPVAKAAAPAINALARYLAEGDPELPPDIERLIGLGPGLTPSGDDFLAAVILTLHATARATQADQLTKTIRPQLANTTPISAAYLTAAFTGHATARLHTLLSTCLAGEASRVAPALAALTAVGHTSGWDAVAGLAIVLRSLPRL